MTPEPKSVSHLPLPELIKLLRAGVAEWRKTERYDERLHRLAVMVRHRIKQERTSERRKTDETAF